MFKPKKSLGQNFLIDQAVLPKIIAAAEIKKGETILEIGPGQGILTEALLSAGASVLAIEKDYELITYLKEKFKSNLKKSRSSESILKIIHQDALVFEPDIKKYKLVANLPRSE